MADNRITVSANSQFSLMVGEKSGQKMATCYQCGNCTAGCPVVNDADITPNQVMRLVQLNDQSVLHSRMIWLCVGCGTCALRCPRGLSSAEVMDTLRQMAEKQGIEAAEPEVHAFHESFLNAIARDGRVFELGLVMEYKLRSRRLVDDIGLGLTMFQKGKLPFRPQRIKGLSQLRQWVKESS
ncbi:MAG: 4Fe-4S dicluster domain-containing protein [Armatimonadota bacterium]